MKTKLDSPRVFVPPPIFYLLVFGCSLILHRFIPLSEEFFETLTASVLGWLFLTAGLCFSGLALFEFFKARNTIVTVKPATSLTTGGIYSISRNPMYLGLLLLYASLACFIGNFWTLLFVPLLIQIVSFFVIRHEEKYLLRAFGTEYAEYVNKVNRWL